MTPDHDILRNSEAWRRLQQGIPREVQPVELRDYLHDWANVLPVIVAHIDRLLDQNEHLGVRIDHRKTEHDAFEDRVFDGEDGIVTKLRNEMRSANVWIVRAVVGALTAATATFITIIVQTQGAG